MSDKTELQKAVEQYEKAKVEADESVTKAVIEVNEIRQDREAQQSHPT